MSDSKAPVAAKATENTAVAVVDQKSVAIEGYDYAELIADQKKGSEGVSADDIAIPYIGILQGLSPQCIEGKEGAIEGARPSMFFNNVTNEIFEGRKNGIFLVPAFYRKQWLMWKTREAGGGLVGVYDTAAILEQCTKNEKGQFVYNNDKDAVVYETAQQFMLMLDMQTGETSRVVFSMKSTALKANRKLNHAIDSAKIPGHPTISAPRFMFAYQVTTFLEEKANNSWWSPEFTRMKDPVSKGVYDQAKAYYELVSSGKAKLADPLAEPDAAGHGQSGSGGDTRDIDEVDF